MANFERERTDQDWYRGLKIPHTVIRNIDEKTRQAVAESGGTWDPTGPIVLGGAGLELQATMRLSGGSVAFPGPSSRFRFGDDDYFRHEAPVSRVIRDPSTLGIVGAHLPRRLKMTLPLPTVDASTTSPMVQVVRTGQRVRIPLRIPDGSKLDRVDIYFIVGATHANVPVNMPRARVVRIRHVDGVLEPYPDQITVGADPDGWVVMERPASGAAWTNSGNARYFVPILEYLVSAGEPADWSRYAYALEWTEESGANAFDDVSAGEYGTIFVQAEITVWSDDLRPY